MSSAKMTMMLGREVVGDCALTNIAGPRKAVTTRKQLNRKWRHIIFGIPRAELLVNDLEMADPRSMRRIIVHDKMQRGYNYECMQPVGQHFDPEFKPELTPKEILALGAFGGKYMTDCQDEFPADWFAEAKLNSKRHDPELNFFKVNASLPLAEWRRKGWIYEEDPRGWFQWYCRYYLGRRIPAEDARQIKRWKALVRHVAQLKQNCRKGDFSCRRKQRQALLHWAYDSRKI
jgi:hypothetical protein